MPRCYRRDSARTTARSFQRVVVVVWNDDIGEDKAPAGPEYLCDPMEEVPLAVAVEVVDGEAGDDEVERALRQRVLEPCDAQVSLHVGGCQHRLALIDSDETGSRVAFEHRPRSDPCADAELEQVSDLHAFGRGGGLFLQLVEHGD